ncbi:MAG: acetyltransferase, partial [Billgrantia desiderata]
MSITLDTPPRTDIVPLQDAAARLVRDATTESLIERIDAVFAHHPELALLILEPAAWQEHADWPRLVEALGGGRVLRSDFYQQPWDWLRHPPTRPEQTPFESGNGHPRRPAKPSGLVYRRADPRLGRIFSLRLIELDRDLERFVQWMHLPRVAEFWEQAWPAS